MSEQPPIWRDAWRKFQDPLLDISKVDQTYPSIFETFVAGYVAGHRGLAEKVGDVLDKYNIAGDNEGVEYNSPEDDWRLFRDLRAEIGETP